jgi:hypothetical protein
MIGACGVAGWWVVEEEPAGEGEESDEEMGF